MPLWKSPLPTLPLEFPAASLNHHLGIRIEAVGDDYVVASMPVDDRTRRSRGFLHGGASVALAETVGGFAGQLCCGEDEYCVGLQIDANHVRRVWDGSVRATATAVHVGAERQVWNIHIVDDEGHTVCMSRLTVAVIRR